MMPTDLFMRAPDLYYPALQHPSSSLSPKNSTAMHGGLICSAWPWSARHRLLVTCDRLVATPGPADARCTPRRPRLQHSTALEDWFLHSGPTARGEVLCLSGRSAHKGERMGPGEFPVVPAHGRYDLGGAFLPPLRCLRTDLLAN